jgi:hypothetical protein
MDLQHGLIGLLEMTAESIRVEERRRPAVFVEPLPIYGKERRVARELERQRLIFLEAPRHELRQTDRMKEAPRHAPGEGAA